MYVKGRTLINDDITPRLHDLTISSNGQYVLNLLQFNSPKGPLECFIRCSNLVGSIWFQGLHHIIFSFSTCCKNSCTHLQVTVLVQSVIDIVEYKGHSLICLFAVYT